MTASIVLVRLCLQAYRDVVDTVTRKVHAAQFLDVLWAAMLGACASVIQNSSKSFWRTDAHSRAHATRLQRYRKCVVEVANFETHVLGERLQRYAEPCRLRLHTASREAACAVNLPPAHRMSRKGLLPLGPAAPFSCATHKRGQNVGAKFRGCRLYIRVLQYVAASHRSNNCRIVVRPPAPSKA